MNQVELAFKVAKKAHEGQFRRDKKTPYIEHPIAVSQRFLTPYPNAECYDLMAIALLHDVVEDTKVTLAQLRKKFPINIVEALDAITKREGENYLDYILRVKKNDLARKVKRADIGHNYPTAISKDKKDKYLLALHILGL